ncbi:TIGR02680 family protein [Streptomyces spiramenti]|uniref:TIGR02680 family protein n=1 Tax=Streptomyces spiramenti TaxID=2720606 RepID=A0ABX1AH21_9ACTN|nr:TIGR02680 family protein [Streptomyces spiramenti]
MGVTAIPAQGQPEHVGVRAPAAEAGRVRWQPHRAGVLNVWRYYDETFTFHDGRLLLRGQNGSGKSKALELLLPFLFDASLRPNRLSTFGGSERTMHWNLIGEGATGKTRVGYVWMEFRRFDDDGGEQWFGCGARLQASVHTTGVQADYFTTRSRIAAPGGVALVNDAGQPLTRAALVDAVGDHGEVHASAGDHRAAVRRELFDGMGEQRYESLLSALLQLRQPKLSERLDPALLSTLLSRALPPLGEGEVAELAEGFERLDRQREHLRRLDDEVAAASAVAARQRAYAQRVLRAGAAVLISATTEMDDLTRAARRSSEELREALTERDSVGERRRERELTEVALEETVRTLVDSDEFRHGKGLDRLLRSAQEAERRARTQHEEAQVAGAAAGEDERHAEAAATRAEALDQHAREAAVAAGRSARAAGVESIHHEMSVLLGASHPPEKGAAGRSEEGVEDGPADASGGPAPASNASREARGLLRGAVTARRQQLAQVAGALDEHERAVRDRGSAEALVEKARGRLAHVITRREEAAGAWESALAAQQDRLLAWAGGCAELRFADPEAPAAAAAHEAEVTALIEAAARPLEQELATAEAAADATGRALREERDRRAQELRRLREEKDLSPPLPAHRTSDRATAAGAPLWRLVAFRDGVPLAVQAAVEAALEASGLLDAWVDSHHGIVLPGHDTRAEAALAVAAPGANLTEVLRPEEGASVPTEVVDRILSGIAYGTSLPGEHPAEVAADGAWRLALTAGSWSKPEPVYIGAPARERARQRRIGELVGAVNEVDAALDALADQRQELGSRRARLDADRAARPDHRELDARRRGLERAETEVAVHDDAVRDTATRLAESEAAVVAALRTLGAQGAAHRLPTDRGRLSELSSAVENFRDAADSWVDAHLSASAAGGRSRDLAEQAARSRHAARELDRDAAAAETEAVGARARFETADATVGEDYRKRLARVHEARTQLARCREEEREAAGRLVRLEGRIGGLRATSGRDAELREQAFVARDAAARRFRHLCLVGFAQDAGIAPELDAEDGARATLESARAVAAAWPTVPHAPRNLGDAATRLSEAVHEARQRLGARADLDLEPDEDSQLFTATLDGVRVGASGLLTALTQERDRSSQDITSAEQHLFDQILTGDIRRHLATRIRRAGELVDRMNGHLERVRTASDVAVQLVWDVRPDLPEGTRTARQLLLKDPGRVDTADREALHAFFRTRIEEAKSSDTAASWEEQLAQVLDYTAWHRFTVRLDRAKGEGWQLLTKKLHGALSGGEKAIALHLPLFAAVAAHYEAVTSAPRLILLDEVFVGVDAVNRGQVFALLAALDLDLMVTSDHEWCTYGELPGIAVHQLLTDGDDDAVTSARFVWNGTDLAAG